MSMFQDTKKEVCLMSFRDETVFFNMHLIVTLNKKFLSNLFKNTEKHLLDNRKE